MLHIVINPETASGKGAKAWSRIRPLFDKYGCDYKLHISEKPGDIGRILNELTSFDTGRLSEKEFTDIVIIGGDGSMNEAVTSICDFEHTRLGFIPAGSGNDLAKAILKTRDRDELVQRIVKRETVRSVDIGLMESGENRSLFNISSGIGFDARICHEANSIGLKKRLNKIGLGKLVYIFVAVKTILKNKKFFCQIEFDGNERLTYKRCLFAVGMNTAFEGGGFMFCPEASDEDGTLEFCIVDGISALKFFLLFPLAYFGKHIYFKGINIKRAKSVRIRTKTPVWLHTDGEVAFKTDDVRLSVYPQKLKLLI